MQGMLRFRRAPRTQAFVPTASMADIAFLLIIFFMVTAEFSVRKGMVFSVSAKGAISNESPDDALVVALDAAGHLSLNGVPSDLAEIRRMLAPRLEVNSGLWVVVRVHGNTPYGAVIQVLDQIRGLGVRNVALPHRVSDAGVNPT